MTIYPQIIMPGATAAFAAQVSFVGAAATTSAATVSMPAHQKNDVIWCMAWREGNATPPTIPSEGWSTILSNLDGNGNSYSFVKKVAADSSEATGTFTNANAVAVGIWRGLDLGNFDGAYQVDFSVANVDWRADTVDLDAPGRNWVVGFAAGNQGGETVSNFQRTSPATTLRASANTDRWILVQDTNAVVSTISTETATAGTSGPNTSFEFCINPIGSV